MSAENPDINIVLIGFMGSGKSSIGRHLARMLRVDFLDTDQLVVDSTDGMPITEIFAKHGEGEFRRLETAALQSLTEKKDMVVATGGGIVTQPHNIPLLRNIGYVIWLTASEDCLFERVSRNNRRPLVQTADPRGTIHKMLEKRGPLYTEAADCIIDSTTLSHEAVVKIALSRVQQYYGLKPRKHRKPRSPETK